MEFTKAQLTIRSKDPKNQVRAYINKLVPEDVIFIERTPIDTDSNFLANTKPEAGLVFALNQCFSKLLKFGQYVSDREVSPLPFECKISNITPTDYIYTCVDTNTYK